MAQFRNATDETRWVATPDGLVKVEADSILTVSDDFAAAVYFQTGETGEDVLWEAVKVPATKKATASTPTDSPADSAPSA